MKKSAVSVITMLMSVLSATIAVAAQDACSAPEPNGALTSPVVGEWEFRGHMRGWQTMGLITIKKNAEGKYEGKWSTRHWADTNVVDITYKDGKLKFVQTAGTGNQRFRNEFETTFDGNEMKGASKSYGVEISIEGVLLREPNVPRRTGPDAICGTWDIRTSVPDMDLVEKLIITKNKDGTLAGKWESQRGWQTTISDVKYEGGKLTFTRLHKLEEREFKATFEGVVEGDLLKGTFSNETGQRATTASRIITAKAEELKKADANEPASGKNAVRQGSPRAEPNKPAPDKKTDPNKKPI